MLTVTITFSSFEHVGYIVPLLVLHLSVSRQVLCTNSLFLLMGTELHPQANSLNSLLQTLSRLARRKNFIPRVSTSNERGRIFVRKVV